jgi:C_GCAxxG_C_C family probable redox protein
MEGSNMKTKADVSVDIFSKGYSCSQAVLISHCEEYNLSDDIAKKISCGFGGGMGHIDEICGAVSGGIMLIGLKYGKSKDYDNESKEKTYKLVKQYTDKFKNEFGSINCTELVKYNLSKEEELIKAKNSGVFKEICPVLVRRSVELIEEIIGT